MVSCVIGLLLPCYICLVELLAALLSYCLWLFVFSWFKSKRESIDLDILPLLSCQAFFVSALSFPTKWYQSQIQWRSQVQWFDNRWLNHVRKRSSSWRCTSSSNLFYSNEDFVWEIVSERFFVLRHKFCKGYYGEEKQVVED